MSRATPVLGPIVVATVTVGDLDEAARWYADWLEYEPWAEGVVDHALAAAWGTPRAAGSRYRLLAPGAGEPGGVRLVERPRACDGSPLRVPGWRSLELVVADVDELRRRLDGSPFAIVGERAGLESNPSIRAMQAVGPGREMLYLTQTSDDTRFELPSTTRLVGGMFIAVVSVPDIAEAAAFYAREFGAAGEHAVMPTVLEAVNRELGMPLERRHPISALQLAHRSLIEIDEHPPELVDERPPSGDLAGGLAMVSFEHRDLDAVATAVVQPPSVRQEPPYLGRRAATTLGRAGERIELVEGPVV